MTKKLTLLSLTSLMLSLIACHSEDISKDSYTYEAASTYYLERAFQRVVRYDCSGDIVSDQIETVKSPRKSVRISPHQWDNLYSTKFKNVTLGSPAGAVVGRDTFTIDMAEAVFTMRVREGMNEISYEFYYCEQEVEDDSIEGKSTRCAHDPELREAGTVFINVSYFETYRRGSIESRPSEASCKKEKEK